MTDASFSTGSLLAGKYKVLDLLGQGGMGAVYLAENVDIGRQVAIKVLKPELAADPNSLARFKQEARAAASIGHPGIIEIFDMGMLPEGGAFIVMERLVGMTLRDKLATEGSLYPPEAVTLIGAVLDTLAAAHDKGVIHRDLKPDNIFLVSEPTPHTKLLDFGISKFRGTGDVALTRTGMVMGTPLYMSPEQARGARDVGVTADLYSIGAILYEAMSGQPPFPGESYNEVLAKVLMDTARPLGQLRPDVPVELADLIEAMLAKQPAARPQTARDAAAKLRASVPAGYQPAAVPPRGESATFQRPTPPPAMRSAAKQTGPRPPTGIEATFTPPARKVDGNNWRPPTAPPPAAPLSDTHVRPANPGAHAPTAPGPQIVEAVAQPMPPKSGSKALLIVGVVLVAFVAAGVGIRLGQKSVTEPPETPVKAQVGDKEVTFGTGPNGARLQITDKGVKVEAPGTKVEVSDKGVDVSTPGAKVAVGEPAKPAAAVDAGAAEAVEKPATEQAAAEAPAEPAEPARPGHKPGAKWGPRPAGFKPAGNHKAKAGGAVLPGFTPAGSYK